VSLLGQILVMYTVNNSEQLRELSSNDLNFLENEDEDQVLEAEVGNSNSTVSDLDNILDKFEADTQILLDNPNQLLNCKYQQIPSPPPYLAGRFPAKLSLSLSFRFLGLFNQLLGLPGCASWEPSSWVRLELKLSRHYWLSPRVHSASCGLEPSAVYSNEPAGGH